MTAKTTGRRRGAALLLGLDAGTTEFKAVLVRARDGARVAAVSLRLPVSADGGGRREQQPAALGAALSRAAARLRAEAGAAWRQVAGIGLAAQGGSAILADRDTGRALTAMQLWNDTRPLSLLPAIAGRRPASAWTRLTGGLGPGAGLARVAWLCRRCPDLLPSAGQGALYVGAGEYLYFGLTGVWRQDACNALQIGCYDVRRRQLAAWPLALVGAGLDWVAPLRRGHELHPLSAASARRLGLPAGIPVAGPYIDHEAGYLSAAAAGGRPLQVSLGTAWVGNFVCDRPPPRGPGADFLLPAPIGRGTLVLRVMRAGNLTWNWGVRELMGGAGPAAWRRADALCRDDPLPPDGLLAFPWLAQRHALDKALSGNGAFLGVRADTARADLLRALSAGMAFEFACLFDSLRGKPWADGVTLGGGASRGPGFQRLLAALFAPLPVRLAAEPDTAGARGSIFAFSPRAAQAPSRSLARPPARLRARAARQYELYREARSRLFAAP